MILRICGLGGESELCGRRRLTGSDLQGARELGGEPEGVWKDRGTHKHSIRILGLVGA